jgi:hypothetical protein
LALEDKLTRKIQRIQEESERSPAGKIEREVARRRQTSSGRFQERIEHMLIENTAYGNGNPVGTPSVPISHNANTNTGSSRSEPTKLRAENPAVQAARKHAERVSKLGAHILIKYKSTAAFYREMRIHKPDFYCWRRGGAKCSPGIKKRLDDFCDSL